MSNVTNQELTTELRVTCGTITLILSGYGLIVNFYVFRAFRKNPKFDNGFFDLCISRTISNFITCFVFFVWSSPCTILGYIYLPHFFNVFFGQISASGAYIAGMVVQWVMSANRFYVAYWPMGSNRKYAIPISLTVCWLIALGYTLPGFPVNCGYIYHVDLLSWAPENYPCAIGLSEMMFWSILFVSINSNILNILTFIKLIMQIKKRSKSISTVQSHQRQKNSRRMFAQSCTQDVLHVFDMVSCQLICKLNDALWFQFIFMSVVWLGIHVLDGTVMLIYNRPIHPKWCRRTIAIAHASTSNTVETKRI